MAAALLCAWAFCIVSVAPASAAPASAGQALVVLLHDHVARQRPLDLLPPD
jgi:hypothetical protein